MKKPLWLFFAMLFFAIITGCKANVNTAIDIPLEYNSEPQALFCPRDNCGKNLELLLGKAESSIHCALYDLKLENIISMLAKKSHEVAVRVVIDDGTYKEQIKGNVKTDNSRQLMHNKFCIIDNSIVWTGSFNPTENRNESNNNNVIIFYSRLIAENYEDEFNELWNGIFGSGERVKNPAIYLNNKKIENYFCPDDCDNAGIYRAIDLVRKAEKSIQVASFSFTHKELADELIFADIRGINVTVLMEKRQRNTLNSQYERLRDFGINIRLDNNKYIMHHKFIVIDNKIVITGSPNFTLGGNNKNDENMVIIYDENLALEYAREFNRLFSEGT